MYKIIGADQKEYGPVTAEQLRQWLAEGRVNGQTSVWSEGAAEWKPLSAFPEFAALLASKPPVAGAPPPYAAQPGLPPDIFTRDYDLDIGRCVGDAWNLLKNNFGLVFGGVAIFLLIQMGLGGLGQIPLVGLVFSLANIIITGPLMGGVYYFLLKNIRRQPAEIGDVFAGFRLAFGQLLLGYYGGGAPDLPGGSARPRDHGRPDLHDGPPSCRRGGAVAFGLFGLHHRDASGHLFERLLDVLPAADH